LSQEVERRGGWLVLAGQRADVHRQVAALRDAGQLVKVVDGQKSTEDPELIRVRVIVQESPKPEPARRRRAPAWAWAAGAMLVFAVMAGLVWALVTAVGALVALVAAYWVQIVVGAVLVLAASAVLAPRVVEVLVRVRVR
jgi:hypothetical protein